MTARSPCSDEYKNICHVNFTIAVKENLVLISSVLVAAGKKHEATTICNTAIEQLECIASAGTLTGAESWNEILAQLRSTLQ